ncbi:AraC family transcriptional regulator [Alkalicoccobacillus plakortidis]|uniref:ABC transporter substrate-binding protein n=1 Tax=Alkalicoccobacillus plakortidis TaxID=444060 RepID=A0ABT0XN74_9BACI|nr:AraC family transcriptional regulator [Alkalicoccobacillus plakortidis]MCM2677356.1 ABC transporter substrate-binding protein [Alkalicoccobacillus plakortidis]
MLDWKMATVRLKEVKTCAGTWPKGPSYADHYMLIVIYSGNAKMTYGLNERELTPDHFFVINAGESYEITSVEAGVEGALFYFQLYEEIDSSTLVANVEYQFKKTSGKVELDWSHILTIDDTDIFEQQLIFQRALYTCINQGSLTSLDKVKQIKTWMEEHPCNRHRLGELAKLSKVTSTYLSTEFKKETGKSINQFSTKVKIAEAKKLLRTTPLPLKEISAHVGYDDEFYFSRKFKKETGKAPSFYREIHRLKVAAYDKDVLGDLLALHCVPYAAPMHPKWTKAYFEQYQHDVPVHLSAYRADLDWRANLKQIQYVQPNLVIAKKQVSEEQQHLLKQIDSEVLLLDSSKTWRHQLLTIANEIRGEQEATHFLKQYDDVVEECRELIADKKVQPPTIICIKGQSIFLYANKGIQDLFEDVGFQKTMPNAEINLTQLAEKEPSQLWVLHLHDHQTESFYEELRADEIWLGMSAIRNNQVISLPSDLWFEYSATAQYKKLLFLKKQLLSMVE